MPECSDPLQRGCVTHVIYDGSWCHECQGLRVAGKTPADFQQPTAPIVADDEDITRNNHGGDVNSATAHASTPAAHREIVRKRIMAAITEWGDATADEVEHRLEMSHQTCSPRITELRKLGVLVDTGRKRNTRTGRSARVLAPAPAPDRGTP